MGYHIISAAEAASLVKDGDTIGLSGFTPAGTPKAVTPEIAKIAEAEHAAGRPYRINILTGASTGDSCDGVLARAQAIRFRAPYTTNPDFRKAVNRGEIAYNDLHLSQMAQAVRYNFLGHVDTAIIEACDVTPDGKIYLTAAVGISPTVARLADRIIVELNAAHSTAIKGLHDVYEPQDPPRRRAFDVYSPSDRIGLPYIQVDPAKIVGIVEVNKPDEALGRNPEIPAFEMYTEVLQDSVVDLIKQGRVKFGSTCSLTVTNECLRDIYDNMDFFRDKLVLRPSEISNNPEIVRRLGVISINTALEADIYGNVNSTHVCGTKMMNGIGGSGDFTRGAYISFFTCPSVAKEGKISAIVPMVSHQDHSEHSVDIIVTEQGVADLRGKCPMERAELIIEHCAHPSYRDLLRDYLRISAKGHTCHNLSAAFAMHDTFLRTGDMRNTRWEDYVK